MIFLKDDKDFGESDAQNGDCPGVVEASERIGVHLWLHCRLALVHSLVAHNPRTIELLPGLVMCLLSFSFQSGGLYHNLLQTLLLLQSLKKDHKLFLFLIFHIIILL